MAFLPLTLGVRRRAAGAEKVSQNRAQLKSQAEQVLRRDDFTCRFCGFRAEQYQRIVPYEGAEPPFVTACLFCEQCLMLERAGLMGGGVLVWLPEIGQAELNHLMRAIYVARAGKSELANVANQAFDALMARRAEAKKRLGSDDPLLLATVLHENLNDEEYKVAADKLDGIRLLPLDKRVVRTHKGDINQFPQIVKYWESANGPFGTLPIDQWESMFKVASSSIGHA